MIKIIEKRQVITINNKSIELTEEEMYELYLELNKKYDSKEQMNDATKNFIDLMRKGEDSLRLNYSVYYDVPASCKGCSSHPTNGGSGICQCTLGSQVIR